MLSLDSTSVFSNLNQDIVTERIVTTHEQNWYTLYGKRIFDFVVSLFVCAFVLSWMIPLLSLCIRFSSPGPGLFIQVRTGRKGRVFYCLKFRTMYFEKNSAFSQAKQGDPRVTKLGLFLRRTNLDEMPQFLNVLLGDMSLVGPRPHAIQHDGQYWNLIETYPHRYSIRPGITGLAQVRGARGETTDIIRMRHRVKYDLHYIKRQSLLIDIKLCWLTVKPMIKGKVNAW